MPSYSIFGKTYNLMSLYIRSNVVQFIGLLIIAISYFPRSLCFDGCPELNLLIIPSFLGFILLLVDLVITVVFLLSFSNLQKSFNYVLVIIFALFSLRERIIVFATSNVSSPSLTIDEIISFARGSFVTYTAFLGSIALGIIFVTRGMELSNRKIVSLGIINILLPVYITLRAFLIGDIQTSNLVSGTNDSAYIFILIKAFLLPIITAYVFLQISIELGSDENLNITDGT